MAHQDIERAIFYVTEAHKQLKRSLDSTADDRLGWSPAPSARTPIQLAANAALSIPGMSGWMDGEAFEFDSMEAMDADMRLKEKAFTTREGVYEVLDANLAAYIAWLGTFSDERIESVFHSDMGDYPYVVTVNWVGGFLYNRGAQIDYVQTVYGDLSFHM